VNADDSEHYDFDGKFRWDLYGNHLVLSHEEGNSLMNGCENGFFDFLPFDYVQYDGEWVAYDGTRHYSLHLLPNGETIYTVSEGEATICSYGGWWSVSDLMELELSMSRIDGEGEDYISCIYELEWTEYPTEMDIRLRDGSYPLTASMETSGKDSFGWLDPNAVG